VTAPYGAPVAPTAPKPGPSLKLSLVFTFVGLAIAIPTFILGIIPIINAFTSPSFAVPTTNRQMHFGSGNYLVYENTGSTSLFGLQHNNTVTLRPTDVTITGSAGKVDTFYPSDTTVQRLTRNQQEYTGAVEFTTPASGNYTVTIASAAPTRAIIARPLTDTIQKSVGWFLATGIGGLVFVTGIILLIVGAVRRGRAKNRYAFAMPATPAGWYADPGGSQRLRYWDGTRWTEHLH
jgi:hypothetical protein